MKKPEFRKYAEGTDVPPDRSKNEFEALLKRHGAKEFIFATKEEGENRGTRIIYRMHGMMVRQSVLYPAPNDPKYRGTKADAEYRRRWRALVLITKAKLEIIAGGESTFEREFLADLMLPDGKAVGEVLLPQLAEAYETGKTPALLSATGLLLGTGD